MIRNRSIQSLTQNQKNRYWKKMQKKKKQKLMKVLNTLKVKRTAILNQSK